jgi:hypothetical protein
MQKNVWKLYILSPITTCLTLKTLKNNYVW